MRLLQARNLGASYEALKNYESALKNFQCILPIFEDSGDLKQCATTLCNIGLIYSATGKHQEAIQFIRKSLDLRRQIGNRFGIITSVLALHEAYKEGGSPFGVEALNDLLDALALAESIRAKKQIYRLHERLAECYEGLNDTQSAYKHFKAYHALKSEVFSEESDKRLKNLQVSFKVEEAKKQAEIERLKSIELANALAEAEKQHQIAEEASRVKSEVLNIVAHDLQTPISSIINFVYLLKQMTSLSHKQTEILSRVEQVSAAMLRQTVNLLNAAAKEVSGQLRRESVNLDELLQSVAALSGAIAKVKPFASQWRRLLSLLAIPKNSAKSLRTSLETPSNTAQEVRRFPSSVWCTKASIGLQLKTTDRDSRPTT